MSMLGGPAQQTFADIVAAEAQAVTAGQPGCGFLDPGCHGGLTCVRLVHDETAPHVGKDPDGQPVQWMPPCPPPVSTP